VAEMAEMGGADGGGTTLSAVASAGSSRADTTRAAKTRLRLAVLAAAAVLGVLGDALLRALPWGVNLPLWVAALLVAVVVLAAWHRVGLGGEGRWLAVPALLFAGGVAWRDSATLVALNVLAALVALGLAAARARAGRMVLAGVADYVFGLFLVFLEAIGGILMLVLEDVRWREAPRGGWSSQALRIGLGLLIALPLVLVFGGLFIAADAAFAGIVGRLFAWSPTALLGHAALAGAFAWAVGGYLRRVLIAPESQAESGGRQRLAVLGIVELGIVLGLLNALFLLFVLVQFRYFFGGAALVEASADLTYAEYARRGFFELVAVATLLLPLLLFADWIVRTDRANQERLFRALVGALIAMLFVIMLSALQRMRLYVDEFGLTELRVYTTAFMGWLALLSGWFLVTVLRGRRGRFAFGALVSGFAVIFLLNAINPDALIVQANLDRRQVRPFDARYATSLSADAVPTLAAALPTLAEADQQAVRTRLITRWPPAATIDWRTGNWGRWWAREAVRSIAWISLLAPSPATPWQDRGDGGA
jgi:hypothetical protein